MSGILRDIQYSFNKGNNAIRKLIIINVAVFVFTTLLGRFPPTQSLVSSLALPHQFTDFIYQPWSLFTYIFMHGGLFHLLFNMLFLYFIGSIFRDLLGNVHVYKAFIWGGVSGGLLFMTAYSVFPLTESPAATYLVGASGGVTSVIIAAAVFTPDYELRLFGVISVKLKWIAIFRVLMDLLYLGDGNNDGGQLAHLGGAAFGYFYVRFLRSPYRFPSLRFPRWARFGSDPKPRRKFKVSINRKNKTELNGRRTGAGNPSQEAVDLILDKISRSGYDSLSDKEKELLFKASKDL